MRVPVGLVLPFAALAWCSLTSASPAPVEKGAPLYVAEHGRAKVYIVGACGGQGQDWLADGIRNALTESSEFWRELPLAKLSPASIAYSDKLGAAKRQTLFDLLDRKQAARVLSAGQKLGVSREKLAAMKIWYAARVLTFASYAKTERPVGQPDDPELVLSDLASKRAIPMRAESQDWNAFARFFNDMPIEVQKQYLEYSLDDIEHGATDIKAGDLACGRGDSSFFDSMATDFSRRYPALYAYLNGKRDEEWARKIKNFLQHGGVRFIVVGINHTVGPASIQNELAKIGITARRL